MWAIKLAVDLKIGSGHINNAIYILSVEAKDVILANNYVDGSECEYSTKYSSGERNLRAYQNALDFSLEQLALEETYQRIYRRNNFSFESNGKQYTDNIINLKFTYSLKEFNCIRTDTYIRYGYNARCCDFEDGVCIKDGLLVGIKVNCPVEKPISNKLLESFFSFEDGCYHKNKIKTIYSVAQLREKIYCEGFSCNGIFYKRFKRSSGSSRVGKCLFINEKLYPRMEKWQSCGLQIKEGDPLDLASYEAYIALTLSSIIDTIEINFENILVIDDHESVFKDKVIATEIVGTELSTSEKEVEIRNSIWDGQSLLDVSSFGKYKDKGMLLLRNKFFKSCCFQTNIQRFFCDNDIIDISQLNGFTFAKDVSQIKLITTPSSIKYLKFGKLENWLKQLDSLFGVVKYDKPTGKVKDMVQIHYQLLNTLQLSKEDVYKLVEPTLSYLEDICNEPAVLKYHIKYPEDKEFKREPICDKNGIIYNMLSVNSEFYKTKLYHDFKVDLLKSQIKALRCGHIHVRGNYSTLLGNPVEMLNHAIGKFDGKSQIGIGNVYNTNFDFGKTLLGSRSPHITMPASLLAYNKHNEQIERYFCLTNRIVCVNSIGENLLERLSGADFDSDTILLTDNEILVNAARKNYDKFKVPTSLVQAKKTNRFYTDMEKSDLDIKISVNKIGEIINLSHELNSQLWDRLYRGELIEDVQELYNDISQLSVLSGIEIDKAKKEFVIDSTKEMRKIKEKHIKKSKKYNKKPYFFKILSNFKGYEVKNISKYMHYETSMDYLQKIIEDFVKNTKLYRKKNAFVSFSDVVKFDDYNYNKIDWWQTKRIFDTVYRYKIDVVHIWGNKASDYIEKITLTNDLKIQCVEYINKIKMNKNTTFWLIKAIESPEYSSIRRFLFDVFFSQVNSSFFDLVQNSQQITSVLIPNPNGSIAIYGNKYVILYNN